MGSPFGFTGSGDFGSGGGAPFFRELERLLSWSGGPVNWDLARQIAVSAVGGGGVPLLGGLGTAFAGFTGPPPGTPVEADADDMVVEAATPPEPEQLASGSDAEVADAIRLADLWLDEASAFPSGIREASAWSRVDWIEATIPAWKTLCEPVAARVVDAMRDSLSGGIGAITSGDIPPELAAMLPPGTDPAQILAASGQLMGVVEQLGGLLFGAQLGQALGALAADVLSSTEIGLPLGPDGVAALLPTSIASYAEGLERPLDDVRLWLALREAAHQRLFTHVPWLRSSLVAAVEEYARGIDVDPEAIALAARDIDPTDPAAIQRALGDGVFAVEISDGQRAALGRLERLLALVEGWVDHVVATAAGTRLPDAVALREAIRRRRASGGPAEQTFATLVGLELRPRRLREAAALWEAVAASRGIDGRDALWGSPDLLPSDEDLASPADFLRDTAYLHDPTLGDVLDDPIAEIERLEAEGDTPATED